MTAIECLLRYLAANGQTQSIFFRWRQLLNDARDDMVLEATVAARCAAIVTFNRKDFIGVEKFGLEVWTPHQFLMRLGELENSERAKQEKAKQQTKRKKKGS